MQFVYSENAFLNDPDIFNGIDVSYLSYKEKYEEAIRRQTLLYEKVRALLSKGQHDKANVHNKEV